MQLRKFLSNKEINNFKLNFVAKISNYLNRCIIIYIFTRAYNAVLDILNK